MRICAVGDNVVDRYADRGMMFPGGNAVNVAVHARRCGSEAAYIGALGDDDAGRVVAEALRAEGVDLARTRLLHGPNAYAEVRVVDGDRVFGDHDLGVSVFDLDAADLEYLSGFDLVHTGDCSRLEAKVADIARVAPVSFDFSNRPVEYAEPILPHVTLATFSFSGSSNPEVRDLLAWAHARGARYVAVTRGPDGSVVSDGREAIARPAAAVDVVDTLGAGDAFIASACVALVKGLSVDGISAAATRYAASTCRSFGAFGYGAPDRARTERAFSGSLSGASPS